MKLLFYLLWLMALPFILLAVVYEKILHFVYRVMDTDDEPEPQRKRKGKPGENRPQTTDKQRKIVLPERNQQDDDGMNPQERILPYITPEPVKEQEPPKKEERPPIIFEFPRRGGNLKDKRNRRGQPDRGRG